MRNLNGFFKFLKYKGVNIKVVDGDIALTDSSKEPDQEIIQKIKDNKTAIIEYLTLDVDRARPCLSSVSGCIHSMPSIGCMHPDHKNIHDKYRENCDKCNSFVRAGYSKQ